jgi:hypothetical protein
MDKMKLREIKNGRAAMLAMLGFAAQASMTGAGPYDNLMCAPSRSLSVTVVGSRSG